MGDGQFWCLGMHTMQWHTQKFGSTNVHGTKHYHGSLDGTTSIENVGRRVVVVVVEKKKKRMWFVLGNELLPMPMEMLFSS